MILLCYDWMNLFHFLRKTPKNLLLILFAFHGIKVHSFKTSTISKGEGLKIGPKCQQFQVKTVDKCEGGAKNARNCWGLKWTALKDDIGRQLDIGDHALITGWGRITNDLLQANEQFLKENVATRILRKVKVDASNSTIVFLS